MASELRVGVIGATGAVGSEILRLLEGKQWSTAKLKLFGSERSAGTSIVWRGDKVIIDALNNNQFVGLDVVFLAANSEIANQVAPEMAKSGCYVIDNSSAFRMDKTVPLVVPEINFDAIGDHTRIIANPNCSTIIMLMAVAPLRVFGRIKRIIVSTYQSASGAGRDAMIELEESTRAHLDGKEFEPKVLPHPYAFNVFSHNTTIDESGYNGEEVKMILETRKILGDPEIQVNPTCIRVPVLRSHSESITVEFEGEAPDVESVRKVLSSFGGVRVVDDREANHFPMPNETNGQGDVLVGRIRKDVSNPNAISLFACGDQLLKGAALNAVQIAERIFDLN